MYTLTHKQLGRDSHIQFMTWDENKSGTLTVKFEGGRTYQYFNISSSLWNELVRSKNTVGYFIKNIRNKSGIKYQEINN